MNGLESVKTNINLINQKESGNDYEIVMQIPMDLGWIEDVNFIIDNNTYHMDYLKTEDNFAYFKTNLYLETKAIYHYYFSLPYPLFYFLCFFYFILGFL